MTLYKDKYRVESIRLKNWNYSNDGYYFITICTKNRENFLGEIINENIILSETGKIISQEWYKTEKMRLQVKLDEFVIMPNHLHGIIKIENESLNTVETHCNASPTTFNSNKNNLSNIIRGFKSSTTKLIHLKGFLEFQWQLRFYEHIIKTEIELNKVREYIKNNPLNWLQDTNNLEFKKDK